MLWYSGSYEEEGSEAHSSCCSEGDDFEEEHERQSWQSESDVQGMLQPSVGHLHVSGHALKAGTPQNAFFDV